MMKAKPKAPTKSVQPNQKAVDSLPLNTGTWRIEGIPGLYIRCRATSKSYFLQRRVEGSLVNETIGPIPFKQAKEKAMKIWSKMRPATNDDIDLGTAIEAYIDHRQLMKKMVESTAKLARYNADRYLENWKSRTLERIGRDRSGIAALHLTLSEKHGEATCNQVMRLMAAVYRWHRDRIQTELPDWPRKVAEIHSIPARDWAYSEDELKAWWRHTFKPKGAPKAIDKGVSALGQIKRMWWLTALFTGARKGSIEALRWSDVELAKKVIRFSVTKGGRPYSVPMSDLLAELLAAYKKSDDVPPSEWVFPSNIIEGGHLRDVKNPNEGVGPAHRLRHTFRTTLAQIGATPDQARMLLGHSMAGDVSRGYITAPLLIESLRPITNAVAERYLTSIEFDLYRTNTKSP